MRTLDKITKEAKLSHENKKLLSPNGDVYSSSKIQMVLSLFGFKDLQHAQQQGWRLLDE